MPLTDWPLDYLASLSFLTIAAHSGDGVAALEALEILPAEGVDGSAFIWVHANAEADSGCMPGRPSRGHGSSSTASARRRSTGTSNWSGHEGGGACWAGCCCPTTPGGITSASPAAACIRPYDTLMADFVPALKAAGMTGAEVDRLTVDNPRAAFAIRVRRAR